MLRRDKRLLYSIVGYVIGHRNSMQPGRVVCKSKIDAQEEFRMTFWKFVGTARRDGDNAQRLRLLFFTILTCNNTI